MTIQRQTTAKDGVGQLQDVWTEIATRRASLEPLNGREYFTASGENSDVTTRIRLRHDETVAVLKPYDRIIDESQSPQVVYDIQSVINPRERDRELVLMCRRL